MEEADNILNLLKKGEKRGLERLFLKFYEPLVLYAYRFLNNQAEAEDVVQEVFIKFWHRNQFTDIQLYLRSYLYHSVRNNCLNRLESRRELTSISVEIIKDSPVDSVEDEEEQTAQLEKIYAEIEKLPLRTRRIFQAIFLDNKKYKDVAQEEGISVNTVKTLLRRALAELRAKLNRDSFILFYYFLHKMNF